MFRLTPPNLIFSGCLLLLLSSCGNLKIQGEVQEHHNQSFTIPYFSKRGEAFVYKAEITVFKNRISGVFVVKNIEKNHKRVALLSPIGNTLLDIEFSPTGNKIHYVMPDLDRKIILNKLEKYILFLVKSTYKIKTLYHQKESKKVIASIFKKTPVFISIDENQRVTDLRTANKRKNKLEIHYYGTQVEADSISFISNEIPFAMTLKEKE